MPVQIQVVRRVLGILLSLFSITMLTPIPFAMLDEVDRLTAILPFLGGFFATLLTGILLYWPVREEIRQLRLRDGFVVVVLFWGVLGVFGSLPFLLFPALEMSVAQAVFESMSGLTTTGATVIEGLDNLPHTILFYRQQMQWLGGMGIIVLAVAILPMLGIGGMQLYRAETPGPNKDKLTPRIAGTAKALWYIYLSLTIACALAYFVAGMDPFDAVGHSFSTVAIGGFSTHDTSIGHYDSTAIEMIAVVFMLISGVNFALHFMFVRHLDFSECVPDREDRRRSGPKTWREHLFGRRCLGSIRQLSVRHYFEDEELRTYLVILASLTLISTAYLWFTHTAEPGESFTNSLFHVVSIGTTTRVHLRGIFQLAGFPAGAATVREFRRRLCRFDRRWHEGDPACCCCSSRASASCAGCCTPTPP